MGDWTAQIGIDRRTAKIEHYREVRDLLGGQFFVNTSNQFWTAAETRRGLGDKLDYHNENAVDWLGAHVQTERVNGSGSLYAMFGWAQNSYELTTPRSCVTTRTTYLTRSGGSSPAWFGEGAAI